MGWRSMHHLKKLIQIWESGNTIVVDTETTGTGFLSQIVSIAGVYQDGSVAFNSLIRPNLRIPKAATAVHGITDADVADAPRWPQFVPELIEALRGRKVISFNAEFEVRLIKQTFEAYNMQPAYKRMVGALARPYATCAM
jgi:DNA polymerase-3 subunit epsilon